MREPFALNDYEAIWGIKARALHRVGSLASLFRVDPDGAFSHPEYPPLWPLLLTVATRARLPYDDLVATPLWPLLTLAASLLAVRAARASGVPFPFALLAGAAVSLLPYWRTYPGYAEGLLIVFVLGAWRERWSVPARIPAAGVATRDLPHARGMDEAGRARRGSRRPPPCSRSGAAFGRRFSSRFRAFFSPCCPWALVVRRLAPKSAADGFRAGSVLACEPRGGGSARSRRRPRRPRASRSPRRRSSRPRASDAPGARRRGPRVGGTRLRRRSSGRWRSAGSTPSWHVHWAWDRILVVPFAVLLPVLAEALQEAAGTGVATSGSTGASLA